MKLTYIITGVCAFAGGITFLAIGHLPGCAAPVTSNPIDPKPTIADVAATNQTVSTDIGSRATKIDADTSGIVSKTPSTLTSIFAPFIGDIGTQTAGLRQDQGQLQSTQTQLTQASADVSQLQDHNKSLTAANQKLEADKASALQHLMAVLLVLSVVGIGASAALLYLGNLKVAIPLAVGCAGTLVTAVIVSSYAVWLAIGGGVLLLAGIGYLVYQAVTAKKAVAQVVATTEAAKMAMTDHARFFVYGNGPVTGQAAVLQSPSTQKLVAQARKQITTAPQLTPVSLVDQTK